MNGLLADHNVEGHVTRIIDVLISAGYVDVWKKLALTVDSCRSWGISDSTDDRTLWNLCQSRGYSLITANRNHEDENSLEAAIRDGTPADLPAFTLADADRILNDSDYALASGISLIEYLFDLERSPESVLGTGRLYLPSKTK